MDGKFITTERGTALDKKGNRRRKTKESETGRQDCTMVRDLALQLGSLDLNAWSPFICCWASLMLRMLRGLNGGAEELT